MKTAEEILRKKFNNRFFFNLDKEEFHVLKQCMNEYAIEVARQALINASGGFLGASDFAIDIRESITNEKNIPEL